MTYSRASSSKRPKRVGPSSLSGEPEHTGPELAFGLSPSRRRHPSSRQPPGSPGQVPHSGLGCVRRLAHHPAVPRPRSVAGRAMLQRPDGMARGTSRADTTVCRMPRGRYRSSFAGSREGRMVRIEHHQAPEGMAPGNGYSHAVVATGRVVAIAGQVAMDEQGELVGEGDPWVQAERVFENLRLALAAAGTAFADVVKLGVSRRTSRSCRSSGWSGTGTSTRPARRPAPPCRSARCSAQATSWRSRRWPSPSDRELPCLLGLCVQGFAFGGNTGGGAPRG